MAWARLHALAPKSRTEGKWRLISCFCIPYALVIVYSYLASAEKRSKGRAGWVTDKESLTES